MEVEGHEKSCVSDIDDMERIQNNQICKCEVKHIEMVGHDHVSRNSELGSTEVEMEEPSESSDGDLGNPEVEMAGLSKDNRKSRRLRG